MSRIETEKTDPFEMPELSEFLDWICIYLIIVSSCSNYGKEFEIFPDFRIP